MEAAAECQILLITAAAGSYLWFIGWQLFVVFCGFAFDFMVNWLWTGNSRKLYLNIIIESVLYNLSVLREHPYPSIYPVRVVVQKNKCQALCGRAPCVCKPHTKVLPLTWGLWVCFWSMHKQFLHPPSPPHYFQLNTSSEGMLICTCRAASLSVGKGKPLADIRLSVRLSQQPYGMMVVH